MAESKTYNINNSTVKVIFGDLLESDADVLVISGSVGLPMIGGLPGAVRRIAGETVAADAAKHRNVRLGDVAVTSAGQLRAKYLFHAVTVTSYQEAVAHREIVDNPEVYEYIIGHAIAKSFRLLSAMDLTSIALPCLGLGVGNMPLAAVAGIMAKTICNALSATNKSLSVELYIRDTYNVYTRFDYLPFFEWFAAYTYWKNKENEIEQSDKMPADDNFESVEVADCSAPVQAPHKIFISYSRKDSEKARGVCGLLNEMGIPYWIDFNGIYSGANFKETIVKAISASEIVIFLSSENSNRSDNVAKEIGLADKYGKVIIPVRLDSTPMNPKMDYDLSCIDFVDLFTFDEKSLLRLKNAILGQIAMNMTVKPDDK